jgi:hypothetical protein
MSEVSSTDVKLFVALANPETTRTVVNAQELAGCLRAVGTGGEAGTGAGTGNGTGTGVGTGVGTGAGVGTGVGTGAGVGTGTGGGGGDGAVDDATPQGATKPLAGSAAAPGERRELTGVPEERAGGELSVSGDSVDDSLSDAASNDSISTVGPEGAGCAASEDGSSLADSDASDAPPRRAARGARAGSSRTVASDSGDSASPARSHRRGRSRRAPREDADDLMMEKQSVLLELESLRQQGITLSKTYTVHDRIEDMQFEVRRHLLTIEEKNTVQFMRDSMRLVFTGVEIANGRMGPFLDLDGWASDMGSDLGKYDSALSRLYRKYWRRSASSPEMEIAVGILGSLGMYHFKKKLGGGGDSGMMGDMMGSMMSGLTGGRMGGATGDGRGTRGTGGSGRGGATGTSGASRDAGPGATGARAGRITGHAASRVVIDSSDEEEGLPETFL